MPPFYHLSFRGERERRAKGQNRTKGVNGKRRRMKGRREATINVTSLFECPNDNGKGARERETEMRKEGKVSGNKVLTTAGKKEEDSLFND